jgi:protein-tyrosine-phosphatase
VLTVCDNAKESCPVFSGKTERVHWSIQDPAEAHASKEEKLAVFRNIFGGIQQRVQLLVAAHSSEKEVPR